MKKDSCLPFSYMNTSAFKKALYKNIKKENQDLKKEIESSRKLRSGDYNHIKYLKKENEDLKKRLEKINNTLNTSFIVIDKVQTFEKNQLEIINSMVKGGK